MGSASCLAVALLVLVVWAVMWVCMVSAVLVSVVRAVGNAPGRAVALPAKMLLGLHALVVVRCGVAGCWLALVVSGTPCGRDWA